MAREKFGKFYRITKHFAIQLRTYYYQYYNIFAKLFILPNLFFTFLPNFSFNKVSYYTVFIFLAWLGSCLHSQLLMSQLATCCGYFQSPNNELFLHVMHCILRLHNYDSNVHSKCIATCYNNSTMPLSKLQKVITELGRHDCSWFCKGGLVTGSF